VSGRASRGSAGLPRRALAPLRAMAPEGAARGPHETSVDLPLLVSIASAVQLTGCSRSLIYELIAAREITAVKVGRRTLIPRGEFLRWIESLPASV
jgi:excisionase family DNA binding protein